MVHREMGEGKVILNNGKKLYFSLPSWRFEELGEKLEGGNAGEGWKNRPQKN